LNYKETLYFIAKCLTISLEDKNRDEIELMLKTTDVNWESVVKVSTSHYVFPALYCNFHRANFLHYLPEELVAYMQYITNLNRERNKNIITQARELNTLLLANNITTIFLKGTGNLLAGLYEDIGERMVGDIDFLFSKEDYLKAIIILKKQGYHEIVKSQLNSYYWSKHYPRLSKENNIAAIEIHENLTLEMYTNEFNYSFVDKDSQVISGVTVLSYANKLNLSIIAHQINDNGFYFKTMALRNAYDVFLLSKKTKAKDAVNALDKLTNPLNCFLAACYEIFNNSITLEYQKTEKIIKYLNLFKSKLTYSKELKRRQNNKIKKYLHLKIILNKIYKSLLYKDVRIWLFYFVIDINSWKRLIKNLNKK
jgi:hypothetical protein